MRSRGVYKVCAYLVVVPEPHRHLFHLCPQTCCSDVTTRTSVTQLSLPPSVMQAVIHTCSTLLPIPVRWHHCPLSLCQRPQQGQPSTSDMPV